MSEVLQESAGWKMREGRCKRRCSSAKGESLQNILICRKERRREAVSSTPFLNGRGGKKRREGEGLRRKLLEKESGSERGPEPRAGS